MGKTIVIVLGLLSVAGGVGYWIGQQYPHPAQPRAISSTPPSKVSKKNIFVCPMHSQIAQTHPGTCPICGMSLVETGTSDHEEDAGLMHVDTATQQKLGITLASAEMQTIAHEIRTYATVIPDEGALHPITPTVDGVLVKLKATQTGQHIGPGQLLYEIESPELIQLQHEYIDYLVRLSQTQNAAARQREQNKLAQQNISNLDAAGRELQARSIRQSEEQIESMLQPTARDGVRLVTRLKYAGLTDAMLATIAKKGIAITVIPVYTHKACLVKEIGARPGMVVAAMTPIVTCVDDARLWLEVALYPDQIPFIKSGDALSVRLENGTPFKTTLTNISDLVDPTTRTVHARFPLSGQRMRIGEFANVTIQAAPHQTLAVPRSAVLRNGNGDFVMQQKQPGHFLPTKVATGIETEDKIEIRSGLQVGDKVVINGQFLLDAAASIADAAQRFSGGDQPAQSH